MQYKYQVILFVLFTACKKYKDPTPISDSRLTTKYCNDPSAVNYNWDFPGIPDNSVCIFPTDIFIGNYFYRDSTLNTEGGIISRDSFTISISKIDTTHLQIIGFCGNNIHTAKASRFFKFVIDSLAGNGQLYCNNKDTIAGYATKYGIADTNTIKFNYQLQTDTGIVTHTGTAIKQ